MSQQVREFLGVEVKQVHVSAQGDVVPQFEWRLQEDAEGPEQGPDGDAAVELGDVGVEEQGAFGPLGPLLFDAVAAVPPAGGIVAPLVAAVAGVISPAVLGVTRAGGGEDKKEKKKL